MKEETKLNKQFTAIVWQEDDWYVTKCHEVEVASQGKTKQEALELYFEDEPKPEDIYWYSDSISVEKINLHA